MIFQKKSSDMKFHYSIYRIVRLIYEPLHFQKWIDFPENHLFGISENVSIKLKLKIYFRFFNWAVRQNRVRRATVRSQKSWAIFIKVNRANWTRIIAIISGLKIIYQRKPISLNIIRWVIIMNHQLLEIRLIILNSISIWRNTNNITEQNYSYIQNKWRTIVLSICTRFVRQKITKICQISAENDEFWAKFGQKWPKSGPKSPIFGRKLQFLQWNRPKMIIFSTFNTKNKI